MLLLRGQAGGGGSKDKVGNRESGGGEEGAKRHSKTGRWKKEIETHVVCWFLAGSLGGDVACELSRLLAPANLSEERSSVSMRAAEGTKKKRA